ncbi:MAG: flavodoxin family protein [Candidatus Thorarchaeota archaeon]|nr:MAG: flavodoxin family protein [Candidatus Thorarchaeota archaeon]
MAKPAEKSVIGIVGSPRVRGNTDLLVEEILAGAAEAGAETEKIILIDHSIAACKACNACRTTGSCAHDDDMSSILDRMDKSNVWVLGTPIYWWGPTAQFKTFIDRWYGAKHPRFQEKRVILAIPLGGGHERYARHVVGMLQDTMNYLGMEHHGTILAPGMNNKGEVQEHVKLMAEARRLGRSAFDSDEVGLPTTELTADSGLSANDVH